MMASKNVHTYPTDGRPHDTDGLACWCGPRVEQSCPACDGDTSSCYRCRGMGWVECEAPDVYDGASGLHIIHNRAPDDRARALQAGAALMKYGQHLPGCPFAPERNEYLCTCGYTRATLDAMQAPEDDT